MRTFHRASDGVAGATVAKAAVTGLALGATTCARALGERLMQLAMCRWRAAPLQLVTRRRIWRGPAAAYGPAVGDLSGLTGAALVLNALMGAQQRPQQVTSGLFQGLRSRLPVLALAGTGRLASGRSRRKTTS